MYGMLPEETDLFDVNRFYTEQREKHCDKSLHIQRERAIQALKEEFSKDEMRNKIKIDRVIFVASVADEQVLPTRLIQNVHDICRKEKRSMSIYHNIIIINVLSSIC